MGQRWSIAKKPIFSGVGWGALAFSVSVPVRRAVHGEALFSVGNITSFAVMAAATAAGTWYGNSRTYRNEPPTT